MRKRIKATAIIFPLLIALIGIYEIAQYILLNKSKNSLAKTFVRVNSDLQKTIHTVVNENTLTYNQFEKEMAVDKHRIKPYFDSAEQVKTLSDELVKYIQDIKSKLVSNADEGKLDTQDTLLAYIKDKTIFSIPEEANTLERNIADYRKTLLSTVFYGDSSIIGRELNLSLSDFPHSSLIGDIVMLTTLQNEVRYTESVVINYLKACIIICSETWGIEILPELIPQSTEVMLGDSFKAQVFLGAHLPSVPIKVEIDTINGQRVKGYDVPVDSRHIGRLSIKTNKEGNNSFAGLLKIEAPDGSVKSYYFYSSYVVKKHW